jgi:crossover junction endodeoxyribonuclease RuvC
MRVLGVDPGLTRCGIGVVENLPGGNGKNLTMVAVGVIQTQTDATLDQRLLQLEKELHTWIDEYRPDVIAVERVFSQLNVRTAMATGQAAGVALLLAAKSGIPVVMHTPTQVKAAVTGSGRADKKQIALMVQKLLNLSEIPKPVDSTDALALAICHHWRGGAEDRLTSMAAVERKKIAERKRVSALKSASKSAKVVAK